MNSDSNKKNKIQNKKTLVKTNPESSVIILVKATANPLQARTGRRRRRGVTDSVR